VVKLVKKLSIEVVDTNKNDGEGPSKQKKFHPFFKKINNQPKPSESPGLTLNVDDFNIDNFSYYHQMNHSEKKFPQWINSINLLINQLLDQ
jgi:hypothetical protein